jgi:4-hydroxy-3-methylbut-2-enyl diphosphate reductase
MKPPEIVLLTPRGFCQGVERAIKILDQQIARSDTLREGERYQKGSEHRECRVNASELSEGNRQSTTSRRVEVAEEVWALNQIVHNQYVVRSFQNRGVKFMDFDELKRRFDSLKIANVEGDQPQEHREQRQQRSDQQQPSCGQTQPVVLPKVVLSAHGVAPQVYRELEKRGLEVVDATCPLVRNVHQLAKSYSARGYWVVLIGKAGHEETAGILGESERIVLVETPVGVEDIGHLEDSAPMIWISQTTLSIDDTAEIVAKLRETFPHIESPRTSCICFATQERQNAVKRAAAEGVDFLLVIGSANSSNSQRLVEVGRVAGIARVELVEDESGVDSDWEWGSFTKIAITAGASVPEILVERVLARVRSLVS